MKPIAKWAHFGGLPQAMQTEELLKIIKDLQQRVETLEMEKKSTVTGLVSPVEQNIITPKSLTFKYQIDKESFLKTYIKGKFLITLTFHPSKVVSSKNNLQYIDLGQQSKKLQKCIRLFKKFPYICCFEAHKRHPHIDGDRLHAHVFIDCTYDEAYSTCVDIMKERTLSTNVKILEPSINIKPVKQQQKDIERTHEYLSKFKGGHPNIKEFYSNN